MTKLGLVLICAISCYAQLPAQIDKPSSSELNPIYRSLEAHDWKAAERDLGPLLLLYGGSAKPHFLLGYVLFRENRPTDSLAQYTAAAALETPSVESLLTVCSDYILLSDYADAEHWLVYTAERFQNDHRVWYLLGRTQYRLDQAAEAVASYRKSLELTPHDLPSQYNLGLALEKLGKPAEAEAAYRAAISLQRETGAPDPQPYLDFGLLLMSQHRYEGALTQLMTAAALGPKNAMVQQQLGLTLEALGRDDAAAAALQRAVSLSPAAGQPHLYLGRLYRRLGRKNDAAAQFAEAQRLYGTRSVQETPNEPPLADPEH